MRKRLCFTTMMLLASCTNTSPLFQTGTLVVRLKVVEGHYLTQTIIPIGLPPFNHLTLKLDSDTDKEINIQKQVSGTNVPYAVTFDNLKPNHTYRIKAFAYGDASESILMNSDDPAPFTAVSIPANGLISATLNVKLNDIPLNGLGSTSIHVTPPS